MTNIYILFIMLILLWLQLLFGGMALHVPFCVSGIFYISVAYSWRHGVFWAVLSGISLDLFYNREFFASIWVCLAVVVFAEYWWRRNDTSHLRNCILPGALIAFLSVLPAWIHKLILYNTDIVGILKDMLPITIFTLSLNSLFLPLLVLFLDETGEKLKLPLFMKAGKRLHKDRR